MDDADLKDTSGIRGFCERRWQAGADHGCFTSVGAHVPCLDQKTVRLASSNESIPIPRIFRKLKLVAHPPAADSQSSRFQLYAI